MFAVGSVTAVAAVGSVVARRGAATAAAATGTVGALLTATTERYSLRDAVHAPGGSVTSYGDLLKHVDSTAAGLRDLGFEAGNSIALALDDSLELIVSQLAAARLGLVIVPLAGNADAAAVAGAGDVAGAILSEQSAASGAGAGVNGTVLHTGQQKVEGTYRLRDCLVSGAIAHNRLSKYAATAVKPTSPLFKSASKVMTHKDVVDAAAAAASKAKLGPESRAVPSTGLNDASGNGFVTGTVAPVAAGAAHIVPPVGTAPEVGLMGATAVL